MTEHDPGPARQADPTKGLRCVTLPEVPTVYALYHPEDGVTAWVLALPDEQVILVPVDEDGETEGTGLVHTDLNGVVRRWAPRDEADLVLVTTC
ncbi:MAG: hypothetical protein ACRDQX_02930 [Pseudonocardiaceae bacterium]